MRIVIVTPAPRGSRKGNRVTAQRWAGLLRSLGHRVTVTDEYRGQPAALLIALHARKSARSIVSFRAHSPDRPIVLALTGTDLYGDIHDHPVARRSLELADRLVILQPCGLQELSDRHRAKAQVIYQSVEPLSDRPAPLKAVFEVSVVGHLRPVKDPFRAAWAARRLPPASRIRITHVGAALSGQMARRAERHMRANRRYRWLGERPHWQTRRYIARSRLLVLSSKLEGGANVISEAIAARVPVLCTRIPGSIGLLGAGYPGYFPVGDTAVLARLLRRCEIDPGFYKLLKQRCARLRPLVSPRRERQSWRRLLAALPKPDCIDETR